MSLLDRSHDDNVETDFESQVKALDCRGKLLVIREEGPEIVFSPEYRNQLLADTGALGVLCLQEGFADAAEPTDFPSGTCVVLQYDPGGYELNLRGLGIKQVAAISAALRALQEQERKEKEAFNWVPYNNDPVFRVPVAGHYRISVGSPDPNNSHGSTSIIAQDARTATGKFHEAQDTLHHTEFNCKGFTTHGAFEALAASQTHQADRAGVSIGGEAIPTAEGVKIEIDTKEIQDILRSLELADQIRARGPECDCGARIAGSTHAHWCWTQQELR